MYLMYKTSLIFYQKISFEYISILTSVYARYLFSSTEAKKYLTCRANNGSMKRKCAYNSTHNH